MSSDNKVDISFSFQHDRTGNKFLQRGVYAAVQNKLGTLIYDEDAFAIFNFISFGEGALPAPEKLKYSSYLITLGWADMFSNDEISKRIQENYPQAKLLFILRSQLTALPSYYRYVYAKSGGAESYKVFVDAMLTTELYDYDKCVEKYVKYFGNERVKVFFFEDMRRDPATYVRKILAYSGLKEEDVTPDLTGLAKNQSPSDYDVKASILFNRCFVPIKFILPSNYIDKFREKLTPYFIQSLYMLGLNKLGDISLCDTSEAKEKINARYRESNRKLFEFLELDPSQYDYPF